MTISRIKQLETDILRERNNYYNDQSVVSDKVFDAWIDELKTLDPNNIAIISIGAPVNASEWKKASHKIPMGSLNKVNTPTELSKWVEDNAPNEKLLVIEKLDGLSIEVIYDKGELSQGITRGSGLIGDDISINVMKMNGVPDKLKSNFTGSLRGEIIMKKSIHQKYFSDKANPRNAASGVSKRLDSVGSEHLDILFYQALGDIDFKTEEEQLNWLIAQGIAVPNFVIFGNATDINKYWRKYQDKDRAKLDYDIDGLVVRINDLDKQTALGSKDLRPAGAVAFKFDNEMRETTIIDCHWQIGSMGRITPVAIVEPTILCGAEVKRANLYNISYIKELQLDIGAKVLICRANEVIPRVEELVKGTGKILSIPTNCPECNSNLEMQGENLVCINTLTCPAQMIGRVKNWVEELNLLEWGESLLQKLVETGKVLTVADLYKLTVDDLANIERMGDKSAQKCYDILWNNNEIDLEVFLGGLSIPLIGQSTIKLIMNSGCNTLEKFGQLKAEHFEQVPGVGPIKAKSLAKGLEDNKDLILEIIKNGVKIKEITIGKLTGKSFAITGTLSIKRAEVEKMIKDHGGDIKNNIAKGLTYLITNDKESGSSKNKKAAALNVEIINEQDFFSLLK